MIEDSSRLPSDQEGDVFTGIPLQEDGGVFTGIPVVDGPRRRRISNDLYASDEEEDLQDSEQETRERHEELLARTRLSLFVVLLCALFYILSVGFTPLWEVQYVRVGYVSSRYPSNDHPGEDIVPITSVESSVPKLASETFDDFVAQHKHVFVNFDTSWCSWCQRLAPDWTRFAQRHHFGDLEVVHVDCEEEPSLCRKNQIIAYPTLRWFTDGEIRNDYAGNRNVEALLSYARREMRRKPRQLPLVPQEDPRSLLQLVSDGHATLVPYSEFPSLQNALDHSDVVLLYFAASWCPASTPMTEMLDAVFGEMLLPPKGSNRGSQPHPLSLVYVSSDNSAEDMNSYARKNWMTVPFEEFKERAALKKYFKVAGKKELPSLGMDSRIGGLPSVLVLSGKTRKVITYQGVEDLQEKRSEALNYWISLADADKPAFQEAA
ncbi:disulfide isomerase-like 1-4 [Seminavis robusta]|uniref:Disulfide isomerase-like 1-4 n=1 Tax=Seminavis robusta TaxID=568900 RepID=A0A9N8HG83_9STRA|nr:disulfide isomerase-like 1-4 [Seminavis robusta]|eukprot:Sro386_g131920.1 disulfide isomerase-like 1-4 (434) ;mRNA; f:45137-46539